MPKMRSIFSIIAYRGDIMSLSHEREVIGEALDLIDDMEEVLKVMDVPIEEDEDNIFTPSRISKVRTGLLGLWEALG